MSRRPNNLLVVGDEERFDLQGPSDHVPPGHERLISDKVGDDTCAWVSDRPELLGRPTWRGDTA